MREFCQSVLGERVSKFRQGLHVTLQIAAAASHGGVCLADIPDMESLLGLLR